MPRIPIAEALIDADTRLHDALGDRYHAGIPYQLKNHLIKHAYTSGMLANKLAGMSNQEKSLALAKLDEFHGEKLAAELERYTASLIAEEPRAVREGNVLSDLELED